jgi:hypothetical protein
MTKTKYSQPPGMARTAPSGRSGTSRRPLYLLGGGVLSALVGAATLTRPGLAVISAVHAFLEFYIGVVCLVALSITVMVGLAMTDRIVLMIRHRVLMQGIHRAMAVTSMVALVIHIFLKVVDKYVTPIDVVIPFMAVHPRSFFVGLGTIASYLMFLITWTGIARGRFAGSRHPWGWRVMHAMSYLCWPVALLHGLEAGRHAKTWVFVSYILCVTLVFVALTVRLSVTWGRRLGGPKASTTGTIKPVGKMGPVPAAVSIAMSVPGAPEPTSGIPDAPVTAPVGAVFRDAPVTAPVGALRDAPVTAPVGVVPEAPVTAPVGSSALTAPSGARATLSSRTRRATASAPVPEPAEKKVRSRQWPPVDDDEPFDDEPPPVRHKRRAATAGPALDDEPAYLGPTFPESAYPEPPAAEEPRETREVREPRRTRYKEDDADTGYRGGRRSRDDERERDQDRPPVRRSRRLPDEPPPYEPVISADDPAVANAFPRVGRRSASRSPVRQEEAPARRRRGTGNPPTGSPSPANPPSVPPPPRQRRSAEPMPDLAVEPTTAPPARSMEDASDDEFWAHMRGEAV